MKKRQLQKDYFFCYNKNLAHYLRYKEGFEFITKAQHTDSKVVFSVFEKSGELQRAITSYQNEKQDYKL